MKMIKYVLTPQGTIPEYVTDGGYLAWENGGTSPQNLDLVGVANNSATETSFVNEAALLAYCQGKNFIFKNKINICLSSTKYFQGKQSLLSFSGDGLCLALNFNRDHKSSLFIGMIMGMVVHICFQVIAFSTFKNHLKHYCHLMGAV